MKIKSLYTLILMIALVGISLNGRAQDFGDEGGGDDGSGQVSTDPGGDENPDPGNVDDNNTNPLDQGCCPGSCCPNGPDPSTHNPPTTDTDPDPQEGDMRDLPNSDGTISTWQYSNGKWTERSYAQDPTLPPSSGSTGGTGGTGGSSSTGVSGNGITQNSDGSYTITFPDGTTITTNTNDTYDVTSGQGSCDGCSAAQAENDIPPGAPPPVMPSNPTPGQINTFDLAMQLYEAAQAAHGGPTPPPPPPNPTNPCAYLIPSTLNQADRIADLNQIMGTESNPFAIDFIPSNTPANLAQDWKDLATFTITPAKIAKLNTIVSVDNLYDPTTQSVITTRDVAHVQSINDAYSSVVNMDYFPINITRLPTIGGTQWSALDVLQYVRTHINLLVNTSITSFTPYNYFGVNDATLWNSTNPDGAIVSLAIPGDYGSVITTFPFTANYWIFTTIHDPENGDHPVSGNRQFGFNLNPDGTYTFFTKGVDRLTGALGTALQSTLGVPFNNADALWTSFQKGVVAWITANGGAAAVVAPVVNRPNWSLVQQVLNGSVPPCAIAPH